MSDGLQSTHLQNYSKLLLQTSFAMIMPFFGLYKSWVVSIVKLNIYKASFKLGLVECKKNPFIHLKY